MGDLVGLGFRPELAAGILASLHHIDVLEVMVEDLIPLSRQDLKAYRRLLAHKRLWLHGVSLGLASTLLVEERRLDAFARVIETVQPTGWSEHLAFVRAGGVEIGHLAAPPASVATVEGLAKNVRRAREVIGQTPLLENVATLVRPPGGTLSETTWLLSATGAAEAPLLLDLHNLHANAVNFHFDALEVLRAVAPRVMLVHLAGGRMIRGAGGKQRLLDDHLHAVPEPVFALLEELAGCAPQPLHVVIERDGQYPPMAELLAEIQRAREALSRGRARAVRLAS